MYTEILDQQKIIIKIAMSPFLRALSFELSKLILRPTFIWFSIVYLDIVLSAFAIGNICPIDLSPPPTDFPKHVLLFCRHYLRVGHKS